ncbi:hypothetical protein BOX15_Mlig021704g3 [Macrostomum lignano]|uniref:Uncharacterized protein n=1 Tax=Macrostomum lignano TaxID=282301 RepID=A0A267E9V6_9PLAT|nr:hypothetical protein BOX15_Mlig021704g3 [Macrostomum lignano]
MRSRKQTGKPRKKVTFMKRRQLRHSSCPPEDFDAILEEVVGDAPEKTGEVEEVAVVSSETKEAEAAKPAKASPTGDGHRWKSIEAGSSSRDEIPSSSPSSLPKPPSPKPPSQQQQPTATPIASASKPTTERDAETSATLLAIPAVARKLGQPQSRRQAAEQRVLLSQRRPPVDSVDNKAVVEQMMQRLSDMLRTLHPPGGGAAAAAPATDEDVAATIAANPSPSAARLLAHCQRGQIPERYRQLLRQLVSGTRQQRAGDRRRSEWEKKLLYEK